MNCLSKVSLHSNVNVSYQAHESIVNNRYWYSDEPNLLDAAFNAAETASRAKAVVDIFYRASNRRERVLPRKYAQLAEKLVYCPLRRCGSSACLECLRAFQQAKSAAQNELIAELTMKYPSQLGCLVTIVPLEMNIPCGRLHEFNAVEFNAQLTGILGSGGLLRKPFLGSIDFELKGSDVKYWQPHWHTVMLSDDPASLRQEVKDLFPAINSYDYPVDVTPMNDLDCVPYVHKIIKAKQLLRNGRTQLPELMVMLDQINPLDFMVFHGIEMHIENEQINFRS